MKPCVLINVCKELQVDARNPEFFELLLFYLDIGSDPYLADKINVELVHEATLESYFIIAADDFDDMTSFREMWEAVLGGIKYTPEPAYVRALKSRSKPCQT